MSEQNKQVAANRDSFLAQPVTRSANGAWQAS